VDEEEDQDPLPGMSPKTDFGQHVNAQAKLTHASEQNIEQMKC
jgi:hypothetical protein